ncbi:hypothetical protein A4D02_01575 [Niastella koreensis]|uniref:Integral membrane protein n=2 Tax=Niastella koreensis TaxID=354356 RepID=G8TF68_NIAKG|nr:TMEM175 family protein [Niastella koreensis]AEW02688.1 protein of unknown function DUF1211 [Niastella koreensis GR20-10]OQP55036.1 hypothetical protein A4D02_01575 [Niastella koreensis]
MNPLHNELKKEFQLERMILFSDAVFAIAITLLAIELKVPVIVTGITDHKLAESLNEMIPKFIGFLISFFIIGQYWTIHHRLFGFVVNYNLRLMWLNLVFLLAVVLMPFTSAFYSEYITYYLKIPSIFYIINICFLGFMNYLMWRYVSNPKHALSEGLVKPVANYYSMRAIAVPIIFLLMALMFLISPHVAIWMPAIIPPVIGLLSKYYKKRIIFSVNK